MNHGGLAGFGFAGRPTRAGSPTRGRPATRTTRSFSTTRRASKLTRATTGYLNDNQPMFDPDGKYLFYASDREFDPVYGSFDNSWTYPNPTRIVAVPLRKDVPSPLHARNDSEDSATIRRSRMSRRRPTRRRKREKKTKQQDKKDDGKAGSARTSTSISTASKLAPSSCRRRPGTTPVCRRSRASCCISRQPRTGSAETKNADRLLRFHRARREAGARRCRGVRSDG